MNTIKNSVRLIGNLGAAPTIYNSEKGTKLAKVAIATSDVFYNEKKEKITETHWHNLVLFGKQADFAEKYLEKGKEIAIEGKLKSRSYTNKDGEKKYITEVIVSEVQLFGKDKS